MATTLYQSTRQSVLALPLQLPALYKKPPSHPSGWRVFVLHVGVPTIAYEPIATELLSYLLGEWPMTKRVIDQEIEKNKELTTNIKGAVERQFKKSA